MRNRTEEINVRVYKTEKNTIRRKAKKCGMNMSEYLRSLGTGAAVREAPRRELMLAYQKLTTLHDTVRYELAMRDFDEVNSLRSNSRTKTVSIVLSLSIAFSYRKSLLMRESLVLY